MKPVAWLGSDGESFTVTEPPSKNYLRQAYWIPLYTADQLRAAQVAVLRKAADRLYAGGEADNTWNILRRMAYELEK